MTDVMRHKLVSEQKLSVSERDGDAYARACGEQSWTIGDLITMRYVPQVHPNLDGSAVRRVELYVFDPKELAAFVAQVREQTIDEVLAVADSLDTTEQENHDEQ